MQRLYPTRWAFKRRTRRGFTLIELLVVIAIISILAAILFPVFAQAREKARQAACLSNEKQIGLALMQYTQDYDDFFPERFGADVASDYIDRYRRTWKTMLLPYIKNKDVFRCPSNPAAQVVDVGKNNVGAPVNSRDGNFPAGYAMWLPNGYLNVIGHGTATYPQNLAGIEHPANSLIIVETSFRHPDCGPYLRYAEPGRDVYPNDPLVPGPSTWYSGHSKKKGNIIYMDGHVKYRALADTFKEEDGLNQWRFSKAEADAKNFANLYQLMTDLARFPGND